MTIYLSSDHGGFKLKETIKKHLESGHYTIVDCGAETFVAGDDYPDYISKAAQLVAANPDSRGIIAGGSGQGEAMVANRTKGVRCALFYAPVVAKEAVDIKGTQSDDPYEILKLSRMHNNANMLSLGGRFLTQEESIRAVDIWLSAPFGGEERHVRRISKF